LRRYIFTECERRRLKAWLETGVEDNQTQKLFTMVRRGLNPIRRDVELLSGVAARLRKQGRLMGIVRQPEESHSPSRSEESG
jgi:hypothetical protein